MQISDLNTSGTFSGSDVLAIEVNGITYKLNGDTLAAALKTIGNYLSTSNLPLQVSSGGTGLTTSPSLLVNLESTDAANVMAAAPRPGVNGVLPIANGGTGASTWNDALRNLGTVPCIVLASTDTTWANIFPKLEQITTSRTAPVFINGNAASVITNGKITNGLGGIVCRQAADTFAFMACPLLANISLIYTWRITGVSATGATFGGVYKYTGTAV